MAVPSFNSRILIGDYSLSGTTRKIDPAYAATMLDSTVLTDTAKTFVVGQATSTLAVEGLLDTSGAADAELDQFFDWTGPEAVTVGPNGLAVGSEVWLVNALKAKLTVGASVSDLVTFSLDLQTDGATDLGVSLSDLAARSAAAFGTSVDGGAASSNGGVLNVHCTAYSGFTSILCKAQHSTDNFAADTVDLITPPVLTGVGQQRVSTTGTVNRYVRLSFIKVGTGSATIAVGFARR